MFLESNICWVSSGTVRARYCWDPREVKGAKPGMKKWRRGKGTWKLNILKSHQHKFYKFIGHIYVHVILTFQLPYSQPIYGDQHWADQGIGGRWWLQTLWQTQGGWDLHMWELWVWECGNRYRKGPRYRYSKFDRCSQQADGQKGLRCRARQRYQRPRKIYFFFQIMINLSEWCYRFTRAYYLRRRDNGECVHHTVWVFFTNFRN